MTSPYHSFWVGDAQAVEKFVVVKYMYMTWNEITWKEQNIKPMRFDQQNIFYIGCTNG